MNKHSIAVIAAAVAIGLGTPLTSHAQLGGLLGSTKPGASNSGGADLVGQQDSLVRNYVAAGNDVVAANDQMARAMGIKTEVINLAATGDAVTVSNLESRDKAMGQNVSLVNEGLKSKGQLKDAEAKANFAKGLVLLVSGVKKYTDMRKDVQAFSSGLSSVSPMQIGKLSSGAYVVKTLPTNMTNLTSVLNNAIDFAKNNGVEVPKDATSLL